MIQGVCPLCGSKGCIVGEDQVTPDTLKYWCQTHCDSFRIGSVFLRYKWATITEDDKSAITAYMHATKGPQRAAPLIQWDNYREYITQGRLFQQRIVASEPPSAK